MEKQNVNVVVFANSDGQAIDTLMVSGERTFKSGSKGFYAGGKISINGVRYQVSCSLVEVGSKPTGFGL